MKDEDVPTLKDYEMVKNMDAFEYNPDTGIFHWKNPINKAIKPGDVAGHKSTVSGYIAITFNYVKFFGHRLAWYLTYGEIPNGEIDHINGKKDDNRIDNLRVTDRKENGRNVSKPITNSSGCVGVRWHKTAKKWNARIKIDQKDIYLGLFENFEDAVKARKEAEKKFGFHTNHGRENPNSSHKKK